MKVESPIAQIIRTATEQNINNTGDTETDNNQKTLPASEYYLLKFFWPG